MGSNTRIFIKREDIKPLLLENPNLAMFLSDIIGKRWYWFREKWSIGQSITLMPSTKIMMVLTSQPKDTSDWKKMMTACQKYHLIFQSDYNETEHEGFVGLGQVLEKIRKMIEEVKEWETKA